LYEDTASSLISRLEHIVVRLHHERIKRQKELVEHLWRRQNAPIEFQPTTDTISVPTPLMTFPLSAFSEVFAGS